MRRYLGLAVVLGLLGCSKALDPAANPLRESPSPSRSVLETSAAPELSPADTLALAAQAMADLSDATYVGTTRIRLHAAQQEFSTQWVMARGGTCQVTNSSKSLGEITTRQLKKASFDRYDRRAVVRLLGLPAYYAQDYAGKWVRSDRDLLGAKACLPTELVPGPAFRGTFVEGAVSRIGDRDVRRFDGRNAYGPMSVWIAITDDPVVMRWKGATRGESRDLWLTGVDQGRKLSRPSSGQIADLP